MSESYGGSGRGYVVAWCMLLSPLTTYCVFPAYEIASENHDGGSGGRDGEGGDGSGGGISDEPCVAPDRRCGETGLPETCNEDGDWIAGAACPYVCVDGECGGSCAPDTRECADGTVPQRCGADGEWDPEPACEVLCTRGECAGSCDEDTTQCAAGRLLTCTGGAWDEGVECEFVCLGAVTPAVCGGECKPNDTECPDVNSIETCGADGEWGDAVDCTDQACTGDPGVCTGSCSPGETACTPDNEVETCTDVGGHDYDQCVEQWCLVSGGVASCTGYCEPGETTCDAGDAATCVDGAWGDHLDCGANGICRSGSCENAVHNIGNSTLFSATPPTTEGNNFYFFRINSVEHGATVLELQALGTVSGGNFARFALYSDNAGAPGTRLATTGDVAVVNGENGGAPSPATTIVDGTTYWIGVVFSGTVSVGRRSNAGAPVAYRENSGTYTFGTSFPVSDPVTNLGLTVLTGVEFNVYLTVHDLD